MSYSRIRLQQMRRNIRLAAVSLSDISEVDMLIKKMQADKRIYEVHRITSLS